VSGASSSRGCTPSSPAASSTIVCGEHGQAGRKGRH
jgi:hypothetical protein